MFSEIAEIKSIREQKSRLSEREKELTEPMLTDLDMIGELYGWFKEIVGDRDCKLRVGSTQSRKQFILIVLYLYCPDALVGGRLRPGIRDRLACAVGCHPPFISNNIDSVLFFGQRYEDFRDNVNEVLVEIVKRIKPGD